MIWLVRFWIAVAAEIVLLASFNFFADWTLEFMPVNFVLAAIASGVAYFAAASLFARVHISQRRATLIFWSVAILLRVVALPLPPGDDLWRYQWEGKIQQAGFNPYLTTPDDPKLEDVRVQFDAWGKINHRDYGAIYPPGAQLIFAALSRISDRPLLYKIVFAAADLGTIAVLLALISRERAPSMEGGASATPTNSSGAPQMVKHQRAAWYAWNPLVVYSFAGAAHFDSLMILPMIAAVLFIQGSTESTSARPRWLLALAASAALGAAIAIKLVPVLLLPIFAFALGLRAITLTASVAIPALLSVLYGWPQFPIWDSLRRFANITRLNDLFWWLIEDTVWPNPRQKNYHYNVVLIIAVVLVSLFFIRNWKRGMLWVLGASLVLSPVLHPWYCTWILPIATWRRAYAWHVLSVTLFAYFLFWNERLFTIPWRSEPWLRTIIIVPPLVAAFLLYRRRAATALSTAA